MNTWYFLRPQWFFSQSNVLGRARKNLVRKSDIAKCNDKIVIWNSNRIHFQSMIMEMKFSIRISIPTEIKISSVMRRAVTSLENTNREVSCQLLHFTLGLQFSERDESAACTQNELSNSRERITNPWDRITNPWEWIAQFDITNGLPRRWRSELDRSPRKRKVGCSNPSRDRLKSVVKQVVTVSLLNTQQ